MKQAKIIPFAGEHQLPLPLRRRPGREAEVIDLHTYKQGYTSPPPVDLSLYSNMLPEHICIANKVGTILGRLRGRINTSSRTPESQPEYRTLTNILESLDDQCEVLRWNNGQPEKILSLESLKQFILDGRNRVLYE